MLHSLAIRNLGLIENLTLDFQPGFTVLTGETGAGKSMVLDALGLTLGGRAEAGLIRHGETTTDVTATFHPVTTPALTDLLDHHGLTLEDGQLILRRQLKREGDMNAPATKATSRAWVNGTTVPVATLAALAEELVDIHSQHGTMALFKPAAQKEVLDAFAGTGNLLTQTRLSHAAWKQSAAALAHAESEAARLAEEADLRTAWLEELERLAYQPGEEETLRQQKLKLQNLGNLSHYLAGVSEALDGEKGATVSAAQASRHLLQACTLEESLNPLADRLGNALELLRDLASDIESATAALEGDGLNIDEIEDRIHALRDVARKHRTDVAELPNVQQKLIAEQAASNQAESNLHHLQTQTAANRKAFESACANLTKARNAALSKLHQQLHAALAHLLMPKAQVAVTLQPLPPENWNGEGAESVNFLLAANPGQPLQPLAKVASGGELSRLMLALKTVFYTALPPRTVILDEIDTGLAGATASAVGSAMAQLALTHQTLAISHHAQVAAQAQTHWLVSKATHAGQTRTSVQSLGPAARAEEIARLLAGSTITPAARAAAQALLQEAPRHAA